MNYTSYINYMNYTKPGRFYTKFPDETMEQALEAHQGGFLSIEDAIAESNLEPTPTLFEVYDHDLNLVHSGVTENDA